MARYLWLIFAICWNVFFLFLHIFCLLRNSTRYNILLCNICLFSSLLCFYCCLWWVSSVHQIVFCEYCFKSDLVFVWKPFVGFDKVIVCFDIEWKAQAVSGFECELA